MFYTLSVNFAGHIPRAVILFGPLVEVLYEKLCEEVPYKFVQCKPGRASFSANFFTVTNGKSYDTTLFAPVYEISAVTPC